VRRWPSSFGSQKETGENHLVEYTLGSEEDPEVESWRETLVEMEIGS